MDNFPILLIYIYANHRNSVERLAAEMRKKGVSLDVCCVSSAKTVRNSKIKWPFYIPLFCWCIEHKLPVLYKILRYRVMPYALMGLIRKYQYIDFHFFGSVFYPSMRYCKKHNIKYDITLWGSDLLRASDKKLEEMSDGFSYANKIKSTKGMLKALSEKYSKKYDNKVLYTDFGNSMFDYIDEVEVQSEDVLKNMLFPESEGKYIVSCGYNASIKQQHIRIIENLAKLPNEIKKKIFVVFLFSYGVKQEYYETVKKVVENSGLSYHFVEKFLNPHEMARFRKSIDIVINMQETDAFSFSIQEHLYAGNILVLGRWLDYEEFKDNPVYLIKTEFKEISSIVESVILNIDEYKKKCLKNKDAMRKIISWESMSDLWYNGYTR